MSQDEYYDAPFICINLGGAITIEDVSKAVCVAYPYFKYLPATTASYPQQENNYIKSDLFKSPKGL